MAVTRKIGFYSIQLLNVSDDGESIDATKLKEVLKYILEHRKERRKRSISDNRFYFLDEVVDCEISSNIQTWIFKYAEHGRRPPLINKNTLEERDNPRELEEGELERTHLGLRYNENENEIVLLLEEIKAGVTIGRLVDYLEHFASELYRSIRVIRNYRIKHSIIPKHDFLQELGKLQRVHAGYISVSKQLLGSEFLDLSSRIEEVRHNIVIEVKAERKMSVQDFFVDVYNKFTTSSQPISKIRVYGFNEEKNEIILDTELIKQIQHLELETNILTGEINSQEMIGRLTHILLGLQNNG